MAFVDEIEIKLSAGRGGDGVVRWLRLRGKEFGGPAGGDGGRGGDVLIKGIRDRSALRRLVGKKEIRAENGQHGGNKSKHGRKGEDLILELPIGSVVTNTSTMEKYELLSEGQVEKILVGGNGGYGNEYFKSSTNQRPKEFTRGKPGEEALFHIELELVVDAGLVGLPSAGKSSLLNALTGAKSKVGEYDFTTLEPHLGDLYGFILADIPGLIEGASEGKGLGHKFLRHVKRTKVLIHCISLENEDLKGAYKVVRGELNNFHESLKEKREVIILTKTDVVEEGDIKKAETEMGKYSEYVFSVSVLDDDSIKKLSDNLTKILEEER